MALGLIAGCLMGLAAYWHLGPTFEANTQVKVSQKAALPSEGQTRRYGDRGEHIYLIKSDVICQRAVNDFGLNKLPEFEGDDDAAKSISERLTVKRTSGQESSFDNLIDITFIDPDAKTAKAVVEAVVNAYGAYLQANRETNSEEIFANLTRQLKTAEQTIRELDQEYHDWRNAAPFFLSTPVIVTAQGTAMPGQSPYMLELDRINTAVRDNMLKRTAVEAKLKTLKDMLSRNESREAIQMRVLWSLSTGTVSGGGEGGGGAGGGAILTSPPGKAELDSQLLAARLLEHRLLNVLGPGHADVVDVRRQIDALVKLYAQNGYAPPVMDQLNDGQKAATVGSGDLASTYVDVLKDQLDELASSAVLLEKEQKAAMERAKSGMLLEKEDRDWKERIADQKKFRDDLQMKLASFNQSRDQEGYRMEQIAQVRVGKSMKRALKIVGACTMFGVCAVFGLAYFREWYDTSLRSLDEVSETAGAQLLGAVPTFKTSAEAERNARNSRLHPRLCYAHHPGSREAEAFRTIRTAMLFACQEQNVRLLQISSPEPGDGKTTTISNLAVAIAQSGKKVLLIDADMRRPTLHDMFRLSQEAGLSDILLGEIEWMNVVKSTPFATLSVITAGLSPENPAELLSAPAFQTFLKQVREEFDLVLIDSPPVLAVTDACVIAPQTDGMVVVIRMEKNNRTSVSHTREQLDSYGVRLLGVVANDATEAAHRDGYRYDGYDVYYQKPAAPRQAVEPAMV
ncbi:MAG TPA: polysaccharide biosynthesis tyrosine autokinase [Caulifigura sp.]|nr:polysaccharide biosynthesis tyrosine autokinase [Caulifigura sp.]